MLKISVGKITIETTVDGKTTTLTLPGKTTYKVGGKSFREGEPVIWLYEEKRGWGGTRRVFATVVRGTAKRIVIDVEYKDGHHEERAVKPERLERRLI